MMASFSYSEFDLTNFLKAKALTFKVLIVFVFQKFSRFYLLVEKNQLLVVGHLTILGMIKIQHAKKTSTHFLRGENHRYLLE